MAGSQPPNPNVHDDPELERARQRAEDAQKKYEQKKKEKSKRERHLDTRRKVIMGAFILDYVVPKYTNDSDELTSLSQGIGELITGQKYKSAKSRQHEIELFRSVFGPDWADHWNTHIEETENE